MSWEPISWPALGERPALTPSIGGLVYPGRRHLFSGPPESAKTWAAFCLALEVIRAGDPILHIDFEMFAYETRDRLRGMGVSDAELELFLHIEPDVAASDHIIDGLIEDWRPKLAIIDAAAGAYALQGLDDNQRADAEKFARVMIEPFRASGVATIVLDHVVKNADNRRGFAIGTERKVGGVDAHLGFEAVRRLSRGGNGLIRITTHKDRLGWLPRPQAAELALHSDPETHAITWEFRPATAAPDNATSWRPTGLMERVSRYLERQSGPVTRSDIYRDVTGKRDYLIIAVDSLVGDDCATEVRGERRSLLIRSVRPFRESSPVVPESSPRVVPSVVPIVPPPLGGDGDDSDEIERLATLAREIQV